MPAGRPTSCTPEIIEKAIAYIGLDPESNYESYDHAIPSIVGMCRILNRGRSTLYEWADGKDNEFTDILAACNELQEFATINGTLKGTLNATIGKLILGKHGYHDKQEIESKGSLIVQMEEPDVETL